MKGRGGATRPFFMPKEWIVERIEFNEPTKRAIYANAGGACQHCGVKLGPNDGEYDHVKECWEFEAGEADNTEANGEFICPPCHKVKSAAKRKQLVKVRRLHKKHNGTAKPTKNSIKSAGKLQSRPMQSGKAKIPSRPFPKPMKKGE